MAAATIKMAVRPLPVREQKIYKRYSTYKGSPAALLKHVAYMWAKGEPLTNTNFCFSLPPRLICTTNAFPSHSCPTFLSL